ncbi:lysozyme inhibitor LprI family protein [Sphingomonas gei]|nr:lysozyme inhibitor LprI family protein [Sphingomonas gei]
MTFRFAALTIALAGAMLVPTSAFAQSAGAFMTNPAYADPAPVECITTFDMQHCAAHELRTADARMSALYAKLRARLKPAARQRLLAEQRKWLAQRDRGCIAKGDRYRGGTMAGVVTTQCWVDVTKARAKVLAGR